VSAQPIDTTELPSFTQHVFGRKQSDYAVLIPVINEGERIRNQLRGMATLPLGADVLIVDGGSRDGSLDEPFLREHNVRALLIKTGPGKLSAQLRIGFAWLLEQGYQGIVTIDGNGKDGFEAIPAFVTALQEGWDFVQGSRYVPGGVAVNTPLERHLGVRLLHAPLLSLASRFHYTDTTNGFRAFSGRFLCDPRVQPFRAIFDTYNLHYYLSIRAARLGFRVKELPVSRSYPDEGPTPSKIGGLQGKLHVLKQLFLAVAGAYDPR
jgi:dolichol-phosphate mannosyltransferase